MAGACRSRSPARCPTGSPRSGWWELLSWCRSAGARTRNRCDTNPVDSVVATDVTRLEYPKCADDAAVVLYTIKGGGHTWPGGQPLPEWFVGRTTNSIDASSLMWAFFREHPLRRNYEARASAAHRE